MKVIHVLKKIEQVDEDIKELRKMEKSLQRNKSFSNPIYMTIEKQINILLGERIKLLELSIANPPDYLAKEFDGVKKDDLIKPHKKGDRKEGKNKNGKEIKTKGAGKGKPGRPSRADSGDDIPMLTQDMIDSRFSSGKNDESRPLLVKHDDGEDDDDRGVKLLDIALEKGTLNKDEIDKEKKRVRFFRDNFPGGEY
jgi:hypothetical protein